MAATSPNSTKRPTEHWKPSWGISIHYFTTTCGVDHNLLIKHEPISYSHLTNLLEEASRAIHGG